MRMSLDKLHSKHCEFFGGELWMGKHEIAIGEEKNGGVGNVESNTPPTDKGKRIESRRGAKGKFAGSVLKKKTNHVVAG